MGADLLRQWLEADQRKRDRMRRRGEYTIILHVDSTGYAKHPTDEVAGKWILTMAYLMDVPEKLVKEVVKVWAVRFQAQSTPAISLHG